MLCKVDLRLYRRELVRRAAGTLQALLEREARGWFLHFRERRAAQLASQKMPMKDIEQVTAYYKQILYILAFASGFVRSPFIAYVHQE